MATKLSRAAYAGMYGPTVGDRVRLADTEIFIEVEKDFTTYGEEVKFGGGKVIRDGMGQAQTSRSGGAVDTVITNAVILDWWGIVKADIGSFGEWVALSLNDTIIIYDRIRENMGKFRRTRFGELVNTSVNETLGRTLMTSIATSMAMIPFVAVGSDYDRHDDRPTLTIMLPYED